LYELNDVICFESANGSANESANGSKIQKKRKYSFDESNAIKQKQTTFLDTLFSNGVLFETEIITNLKTRFPSNIVTILSLTNYNKITFKHITDPIFFEMTKKAICNGIPIIYQGVLHDSETKTYGLPDLIIRADYINKIFGQKINLTVQRLRATNQMPYYIIDIKNSNIHLSAQSDNVLNNVGTKPFKGQIAIYHRMLSKLQKFDTQKSFILASKWTRKQKDNVYTCTNPFDRLGIINFSDFDKSYINISDDAIKWHQLIRSDNNLTCMEPNHNNLYPNMKNLTDTKFKNVKKFLAEKNHEITNIWKCGIKNRAYAFNMGIHKWSDSRLNSSILSINGKDAFIVDKMLQINRSTDTLLYPNKIKSKFNDWRKINKLAFYLDFETINPTTFELKTWSDTEFNQFCSNDLIFMVGIGYSINNVWTYESFVVNDLSDTNQIDIVYRMFNFITNVCNKHGYCGNKYQDINVYHWSNFEQTILTKTCSKYNIVLPIYKWTDILKLFHEEPIIVKGALNFSLKTIGKTMYENKLIDIYWDDSICKSGLDAMYQAYQLYATSDKKNIIMSDNEQMKIINKYNEIDCKIMWAILNYLRTHH
jgi:hypothetical protein